MKRLPPPWRNLLITVLILSSVLFSVLLSELAPQQAGAQAQVEIVPTVASASLDPGGATTVTFQVTNNSTVERNFRLTFGNVPSGFNIADSGTTLISPLGGQADVAVLITANANVAPGVYGPVIVTATGQASGESNITGTAAIEITVAGATFTPSPTNTGVPTNTPSATISATPGAICRDAFEPDDDIGAATQIEVNTAQRHTLCPVGDEDWFVFGAIGGKVYTIDVPEIVGGIDPSIELFDPEGNSIAFNDDYFNRDPNNPNPGDVRPRIQSFEIPYDGRYYFRIRDVAGRGGIDFFYVVALISEAAGPTPTTVVELCLDLFEPDGLPEQARLITSNELQEDRRLCPTGDADWATFFGKAGKRYIVFTDTRRYRGPNQVNRDTQAGADTVMTLTDRDGVSILDFNDDIPGGNTLDSQIEFIPEVDGFYFVQVKNIGDIGNQFIRYDLVLLLCLPGQTDCGRTTAPVERDVPEPVQTPIGPTPTPIEEFVLDPTSTPDATDTPTP